MFERPKFKEGDKVTLSFKNCEFDQLEELTGFPFDYCESIIDGRGMVLSVKKDPDGVVYRVQMDDNNRIHSLLQEWLD